MTIAGAADYVFLEMLASGRLPTDPVEIYKGCVFQANVGGQHAAESELPTNYVRLLTLRRQLNAGNFETVLQSPLEDDLLLRGDGLFLKGLAHHRLGEAALAVEKMDQAQKVFEQIGESHRALRAAINREIGADDLSNYLGGNLKVLNQLAMNQGYWDLVGNYHKSLAVELIVAGEILPALDEARAAIDSYQRFGCGEDESIAHAVAAICLFLLSRKVESQQQRAKIRVNGAKVKSYLAVLDSCYAGRTPKLTAAHPLAKVRWSLQKLKEDSVGAKILQALRSGPQTKHELCQAIWGSEAYGPVYDTRLHTAINALRKKSQQNIEFSGDRYRLIES